MYRSFSLDLERIDARWTIPSKISCLFLLLITSGCSPKEASSPSHPIGSASGGAVSVEEAVERAWKSRDVKATRELMQNTSLTDFCRAEKLVQHLNGAAVVRWSILPSGKPDNSDVRLSTPGNFARVEVSIWNLTDNVVDVRPDTFRLAVNGLVLSPDVGATCRDPLPSAGLMPGHSVEGSLIYRVEPDSDWETLQMVTSERGFFPMVRQWPGKERITKADLKICSSNRQKVLLYLIAAASNEAKGKDDAGLLMDRYSRASALIWERFIRETRRNDLTTYLVDSCTVRNNRAYLKLSAVNSPERPDSTVMAICALDESSVRIEAFKVGADVTDFASENKRIFPDLLKHVQADESLN